ncbi:PREDICTED: uncharacterized protein LOC106746616 [Dinoponera quadriceps]|uniref:Gustatory receptor n=1 Tax=Dinoponera quadriceps TaxID=609295 RepID=A0A6P3XKE6_DINQU|nr:PREDICTED: uncharacterized protein LOC106746616 [Dinoponera quadriceps]
MTESAVKTPFQNLKFLIIIIKITGLISCQLVNGRLKPASIWGRYYCLAWIFFHCAYTSVNYYEWCIMPPEIAGTLFFLIVLRSNAFFVSLIPYHFVAALQNRIVAKFCDKLEAYDDKATVLGYRRKDKHMFIWLYFAYTLTTLTMKTYYSISQNIERGTMALLKVTFEIVSVIIGTYCVFITVIYLDLIRQRFRHLNQIIVPHVSELPVAELQGKITIYDVRHLHGVLIDCAELINDLYGTGTLFTFMSILVEFVAVIYLFIEDIEDNNAIVTILDLSFQAIYLFAMYHWATLEANRIEESVEKYGLSFQNVKCRMDKIEMMLYFYHARFSFTAADFFILDLTIFLSVNQSLLEFIPLENIMLQILLLSDMFYGTDVYNYNNVNFAIC